MAVTILIHFFLTVTNALTKNSIITTIHAINSFKKLLAQLTEQNEQLRIDHASVIAQSNNKVSDTLRKNEDVSAHDSAAFITFVAMFSFFRIHYLTVH